MTTEQPTKPLKDAVREYYLDAELSPDQLAQLADLARSSVSAEAEAEKPRVTRSASSRLRWVALAATLLLTVGLGGIAYRLDFLKRIRSESSRSDRRENANRIVNGAPISPTITPQVSTERTVAPKLAINQPYKRPIGPVEDEEKKEIDEKPDSGLRTTKNLRGAPDKDGDPTNRRFNTEQYDRIYENAFVRVLDKPLSTFSIDVDTASYANLRRYLLRGKLPPKDAVRIEELINYFKYDYRQPTGDHPFSITTEVGVSPWNPKHRLVQIGLQGKDIPLDKLPPSNLVFLIDTSGSMSDANKLPLLKRAFKMLVGKLRARDRVAIVVYAGSAGLVLPSTPGDEKAKILAALDRLTAGGSTAGGAGIQLAYKIALSNLLKEGNNRVILATDGDFNVGPSSDGELVRIVEAKRKNGIYLTVLGFGMGNYKDSRLEKLADKGNGNYAYIDTIAEAQKVMVREFGGTLFTIAKDVKIQIEFNPTKVQAYRLIGYENRLLKKEDFNNDKKDAGDLGSGHTVTALYEVVPVGVELKLPKVDGLKYQRTKLDPTAKTSRELMTIKFRYKPPTSETSILLTKPVADRTTTLANASRNFRFASAVAQFGMLLRGSKYSGTATYGAVLEVARHALGSDRFGYRHEFIRLVEAAERISHKK
ncbi:MAG: VWA domain-containing protein [Myxococcales bacterium]|nr:VWA domain-containing protein [Myxococcales bacterium]